MKKIISMLLAATMLIPYADILLPASAEGVQEQTVASNEVTDEEYLWHSGLDVSSAQNDIFVEDEKDDVDDSKNDQENSENEKHVESNNSKSNTEEKENFESEDTNNDIKQEPFSTSDSEHEEPLRPIDRDKESKLTIFESKANPTFDVFTYKVSNGNAVILKCNVNTSGEIKIPDKINDYAVTSISDSAFSGCTKVTKLEIPQSVTSIGYQAFKGCTSLNSITLGGVQSIERK